MSRIRHQATAPGPGDYDVYASGIEDRIRPSCLTVGTMYYKPSVKTERAMKIKDYDEAQSEDVGPGYYDSSRGLNVVKPRQIMLANIHSESKATSALMTQSYWDQKASDLRETHDEDRPTKTDIVSARVQSVSIAPPKNVNIRSEKQLTILLRKKLQDVESRSRGNYYNAKYDSCSWVKQPLTTKQTAREIARRVNSRRKQEKQRKHELIEQILAEGILKEEREETMREGDPESETDGAVLSRKQQTGQREDMKGSGYEEEEKGYVSPTEELVGRLSSQVQALKVKSEGDPHSHQTHERSGTGSLGLPSEATKFERQLISVYLKSLKAKKKKV